MENAVVQQIRKKITHSKFGEIFFVSSFPQYDVEYVTKLLAIFEKEGLITRIAKGVNVKPRNLILQGNILIYKKIVSLRQEMRHLNPLHYTNNIMYHAR